MYSCTCFCFVFAVLHVLAKFWYFAILENCFKNMSFLFFFWWLLVSTVLKWQVLVFVISLFTSICSCFCESLFFLGWGFPLSSILFRYCNSSMLLSCDAVFSLVLQISMHSSNIFSCKSFWRILLPRTPKEIRPRIISSSSAWYLQIIYQYYQHSNICNNSLSMFFVSLIKSASFIYWFVPQKNSFRAFIASCIISEKWGHWIPCMLGM